MVKVEKSPNYKRIATEEAFCPVEMLDLWKKVLASPDCDPGFNSLIGFYMSSTAARPQHIMKCLTDLGEQRLAHMDESGIDRQVIALTSPGVQVLDTDSAVSFVKVANDELAQAVRNHPDRFTGMIAIAPQNPAEAAKEIQRGTELGLRGIIVNSHTHGEYLDDPRFYDIFAAAEANGQPLYLHPNTPPRNMIQPMLERGLDGAIFGFTVETGLHALRLITAGVFDKFPKLQVILGHLGETLIFQADRIDYMHQATVRSNRYESMKAIDRKPSDYLRNNFVITTSGFAEEKPIRYVLDFMGADRVMYAMDYPYQHSNEQVIQLDNLNIGDEDKVKYFQTNAERVFGIE
ncbi:amidohydrolase family protein [Paraburkholderia xenovorans]|uniref:amidohydrolase family protein n=1 Tax=Paraburkholderia xenovorans TaxID=36873 RepID=UPI001559D878|nr:amidohydrolase family protein [Paraburkholderia xenovorans]NPT36433.1 amidohydrolase family protein [Paraburkholderia xenovorans]